MARGVFFRQLRIGLLLLVLGLVIIDTWLSRARTHDWTQKERVAVYPIAGDNGLATARALEALDNQQFAALERYIAREARKYGVVTEQPVDLQLRPRIDERPPAPRPGAGPVSNAWWSLRLRWWVWRVTRDDPGPYARIRLFVVFHDPQQRSVVPHSHGLRELLVGVAHVFAGRREWGTNQVVIAHELLHTLGASDKYDSDTNLPIYPEGYAEPQRQPRYPQRFAEIMGGRIPVAPGRAEMPPDLAATIVGPATASEIAWARETRGGLIN